MRSVLSRLFVLFIAVCWIVGPTGCSKTEEKPNPTLEVPDVPPMPKEGGKKAPEKK